ncbi:ribonuclease domain-containing protein [Streptoalloteichus hindustanus]|uniref:Ribonuclease T1 n=1 Tax=Streptoalloteichus hindustanus TaxID=2017 RepID=A0A1M5GTZ5_STRHI|nr:ribonuclease [Streptoalloteichus hindustanus]SHG07189.1 ribonuclease T1 [Streptoalloteichus hindustanus]
MGHISVRAAKALVVSLFAVLGLVGGLASPALAAPEATASLASASCGDTSDFRKVKLSSLPKQAADTVRLIKNDGPFPYPQDGTVFKNREKILPKCPKGYYHEYTVKTPGSSHRGARRIVTGDDGEYFYTSDHYRSFVLVNIYA